MTDSKTREAFEAWAKTEDVDLGCREGSWYQPAYIDTIAQYAWTAYQAARRAALEEAARYLDKLHAQANNQHNYHQFAANGIRALADETQEG